MKLIKYRDAQDKYYKYFWISTKEQILSPDFNSEKEAEEWLEMKKKEFKRQLTGIGRPT